MNRIDRGKLRNTAVLFYVAAMVIVFSFIIALYFTYNVDSVSNRPSEGFTYIDDCSGRQVQNEDAPLGVMTECRTILDEEMVQVDGYLAFYTVHQYADVYINDELVYSMRPGDTSAFTETVGSNWVTVPVYREDAGKELVVDIMPVYEKYRDVTPEFMIGSKMDIYYEWLLADLPELLLSIMVMILGIAMIVIAVYNYLRIGHGKGLANLGICAVMVALWRITDTTFISFLLQEKSVYVSFVSLTMLMILMIPIIRSRYDQFGERVRRVFDIYCIATASVCILEVILQVCGVIEIREIMPVTYIVLGAGALIIIGGLIHDRIFGSSEEERAIAGKTPLICVAGMAIDAVVYYVSGASSGLVFTLASFLIYIVIIGFATIAHYSREQELLNEREKALEKKLMETRVAVMLSQIQPHFLYNSLGAIRGLCAEDSEKAQEALDDFALYLRRNIDSLASDVPIHFSKELEHIETYLNLERLRFGSALHIEYDIDEEDFYVPSLTVQPIVENAVKYAARATYDGCRIVIRTRKKRNGIHIIVEDDGPGFDLFSVGQKNDGRKHIGIENVRLRLEQMVEGRLYVKSTMGKGTVVTMIVPQQTDNENNL